MQFYNFIAKVLRVLKRPTYFSVCKKMDGILKPPTLVGLTSLDRSLFKKEITVPVLNISSNVSTVLPVVKPYMLKMPKLNPVVHEDVIKILLHPDKISCWDDFTKNAVQDLEKVGINPDNLSISRLVLNYDNWNADEIMRSIIPAELDIARSFTIVGHILHLNLRDKLLPYQKVIGQVLMDKIPNVKSIVNKTTAIDNTFRNFQMELICGEDNMVTKVKENGFTFHFDFSKVYWNSRLSTEHQRIVDLLNPSDVLLDVFCGVGPFAIPCSKKGCKVYANDLNPYCYEWLKKNIKANKVKEENIECFNKDGAVFIKSDIKRILLDLQDDNTFLGTIHVTMNLPALALNFVKNFQNLFRRNEIDEDKFSRILPTIHVYYFVNGTDPKLEAFKSFKEVTETNLPEESVTYQYVRNVSPQKDMVKMSFKLPLSYALVDDESPPSKKQCMNSVNSPN